LPVSQRLFLLAGLGFSFCPFRVFVGKFFFTSFPLSESHTELLPGIFLFFRIPCSAITHFLFFPGPGITPLQNKTPRQVLTTLSFSVIRTPLSFLPVTPPSVDARPSNFPLFFFFSKPQSGGVFWERSPLRLVWFSGPPSQFP